MKVITLAKTKELLGITDTSLDAEITRYIPIIDGKVKLITKNQYNMQIIGDVTLDSVIVPVSGLTNSSGGIQNNWVSDNLQEFLEVGTLIEGLGVPADAYIDELYFTFGDTQQNNTLNSIATIDLSATGTETAPSAILTLGINIGLQPVIAKGIAWLISQESITAPVAGVTSKSIGTISLAFSSADADIDYRYGMPSWFVKAFPKYMSGH